MGGDGGKVVIFGRSGSSVSSVPSGSFASSSSRPRRDSGQYGQDKFRVTRERLNLGARQTGAGGGMHEAARRMERDEERARRRNGPSSSSSSARFSRR